MKFSICQRDERNFCMKFTLPKKVLLEKKYLVVKPIDQFNFIENLKKKKKRKTEKKTKCYV